MYDIRFTGAYDRYVRDFAFSLYLYPMISYLGVNLMYFWSSINKFDDLLRQTCFPLSITKNKIFTGNFQIVIYFSQIDNGTDSTIPALPLLCTVRNFLILVLLQNISKFSNQKNNDERVEKWIHEWREISSTSLVEFMFAYRTCSQWIISLNL